VPDRLLSSLLLAFVLSGSFLVYCREYPADVPKLIGVALSYVEANILNRCCVNIYWALCFKLPSPHDEDEVIYVVKFDKGSNLCVTGRLSDEVQKKYGITGGTFFTKDAGLTWHVFSPDSLRARSQQRIDRNRRIYGPELSTLSSKINLLGLFVRLQAPSDSNVLYRYSREEFSKIIERSDDGGKTWIQLKLQIHGSSQPLDTFDIIAIHPESPHILYCWINSSQLKGLYISEDGGESFKLFNKYVGSQVLAIHPKNDSIMYANNENYEIVKTIDGGKTWQKAGKDLGKLFSSYNQLLIDPVESDTVYAVAAGGILKTTNGSPRWCLLNLGDYTLSVNSLIIDPNDHTTLYAGTQYGLIKLMDKGCRWEKIPIFSRLIVEE